MAAALVTLWRRRKPVVVAAIALSYVAYLRLGELATLRVRNLVEPIRPGSAGATGRFSQVILEEESGIPSKTHTFDDSVILDRPDLLWMDRLWRALITGGVPAAIQSLNTGIREASYSDATVRLQSFEALAVSHSLHGKKRNIMVVRAFY